MSDKSKEIQSSISFGSLLAEFDVLLAGGAVPKSAGEPLDALGRKWRRFSWHFTNWNPATGDLLFFLEFVGTRLNKVE